MAHFPAHKLHNTSTGTVAAAQQIAKNDTFRSVFNLENYTIVLHECSARYELASSLTVAFFFYSRARAIDMTAREPEIGTATEREQSGRETTQRTKSCTAPRIYGQATRNKMTRKEIAETHQRPQAQSQGFGLVNVCVLFFALFLSSFRQSLFGWLTADGPLCVIA